ncbi:hypothetical protein MCEMSEM18_02424 [Comamonadaceae bacterium]
MENWGVPSLSVMVAVPEAGVVVAPETGVAVREKDSLPSEITSSVVARRSCTEVAPAGMVTSPVTGVHTGEATVPLLNSRLLAAAVSVPRVAEPLASDGVKTTGLVLGLEMLTVKTALAPSATEMLATDKTGVSLSEPGGPPVPSSRMVVVTVPVAIVAPPVGADRLTEKFSAPSNVVSLVIATVKVWLVTPGANVRVPEVEAKSVPEVAVPLAAL